MIFVTVGTQLPFDRLIKSVDLWAARFPEIEFVVQSGEGGFKSLHCEEKGFISAVEWGNLFSSADLVVAHAGMGTIIKCIDVGKPLIVMPRKSSLNEHRNDHQLATAGQLTGIDNITIVNNEKELNAALNAPPVQISKEGVVNNDNLTLLINEIKSFSLGVSKNV